MLFGLAAFADGHSIGHANIELDAAHREWKPNVRGVHAHSWDCMQPSNVASVQCGANNVVVMQAGDEQVGTIAKASLWVQVAQDNHRGVHS